ncbi:2,5-dihydroxypyridine 5,6-dioxygenase [Paenalcaligenes niemegkensis]|uniref:2,5-dihydroxypyridine 5,6-dioxygenase n=1 Tax=Paenalcaligenes niemegkensis TaxID=2895469 RepID=UPI001EE95B65|nr:2,5-dihydroxypyridine 5,6-dioxygenase [Paenalcaligenes niemegkensis]MCQ9617703.1 2,5-dihydroxypyridine 5,6-dioxygenase [Paenalcaligenes niemegkensis]
MVKKSLFDAWAHLLNLSKLKKGETVAILVGDITHPEHLAAVKSVLTMQGHVYYVMELGEAPSMGLAGDSTAAYAPTALASNPVAIDALTKSSFIVDLMGMYRGGEQKQILDAGSRILLVKEGPEIFIRMIPQQEDKARVIEAVELIKKSQVMQVTSEAGTDLVASFGKYDYLAQYGFSDEPGHWDHSPSAFAAAWPTEESVQGRVVLNAGDVILPFKYYLQTPINLDIKDGYITSITGGFDAKYLREYMASFNDPEAYAVSHLGWGLHDRAHWTGLGMYDKRQTNGMESRSFAGCFMFSTGPNIEGGGTRETECHLDIPMLDCTVKMDDVLVVEKGQLVKR